MLRRKIYDELLAWKQKSNGQTALLIDGARRVGKSYIAEFFARQEYKSHIIIDFGMLHKIFLISLFMKALTLICSLQSLVYSTQRFFTKENL